MTKSSRGVDVASVSVQDYLQMIYRLQTSQSPVSTTALAGQLDVAPASVTGMIRKLHLQGLVEHVPYHGVVLTEAGERDALCLLRRHRLWELFLTEVLGLPWDEVHKEAHRLEHATSARVADSLAGFLDEPQIDPHGQQIPKRDCTLWPRTSLALAEVEVGQMVRLLEVPDDDPARLRRWAKWRLVPGASATVLTWAENRAELTVLVGDQEHRLSQETAGAIRVVLA